MFLEVFISITAAAPASAIFFSTYEILEMQQGRKSIWSVCGTGIWDSNFFFGCVAGTGPFLFAGIGGTRQYENTNAAGPIALAQVNRFGSRSSNKLCVILRFVSDCRKKHNAGRWQKTRL